MMVMELDESPASIPIRRPHVSCLTSVIIKLTTYVSPKAKMLTKCLMVSRVPLSNFRRIFSTGFEADETMTFKSCL